MAYEIVTWTDSTGTTQSKDINTTGVTFTGKIRKLLIQGSNTVNNTLINNGKWYYNNNEASSILLGNTKIVIDGPKLCVTKNSSTSILCPAEYVLTWKSDIVNCCTRTVTIKQKSYVLKDGKTTLDAKLTTTSSKIILGSETHVEIPLTINGLIDDNTSFTNGQYYVNADKDNYCSGSVLEGNISLYNGNNVITVNNIDKLNTGTWYIVVQLNYCDSTDKLVYTLTISKQTLSIWFSYSSEYIDKCSNSINITINPYLNDVQTSIPNEIALQYKIDNDDWYNLPYNETQIMYEYNAILNFDKSFNSGELTIGYNGSIDNYNIVLQCECTKIYRVEPITFKFINSSDNTEIKSISESGNAITFCVSINVPKTNNKYIVHYFDSDSNDLGYKIYDGCDLTILNKQTDICYLYNWTGQVKEFIYECTVTPVNNAVKNGKTVVSVCALNVCENPYNNITIYRIPKVTLSILDRTPAYFDTCSTLKLQLVFNTFDVDLDENYFEGETITLCNESYEYNVTLGKSDTNCPNKYTININGNDIIEAFHLKSDYGKTVEIMGKNLYIDKDTKKYPISTSYTLITYINKPSITIMDYNETTLTQITQSGSTPITFYFTLILTQYNNSICYIDTTGEVKNTPPSVQAECQYYKSTIEISNNLTNGYKYKVTLTPNLNTCPNDQNTCEIIASTVCGRQTKTITIKHTHDYDWKLQYEKIN